MKDNKSQKPLTTLSPTELAELRKGFTSAEVNFLQYPIGTLDKKFKGQSIVFRDQIPFGDKQIEIEWEVTGNAKYGLPGPSAVELDNVLTKLIQEPKRRMNGLVPKWIKTTYYEIAKEMGTNTDGRTYDRIKRDLLKLRTCSIVSRGAYKQKNKPSPYEVQSISKYQTIILKGQPAESWIPESERGKEGLAEYVYILLGDVYWTSLNEHYTKPINYDYMMSLGSVTLERIYQLLSLGYQTRMKENGDGRPCLNYNYQEFCGRLPIKALASAFLAKGQLKKLLVRMVQSGYVESFEFEFRGAPDRWFVRFYPGPRANEELEVIRGQRLLFENLDAAGRIARIPRKATPKKLAEVPGDLKRRNDELLQKYTDLPQIVRDQIDSRARELKRDKYHNLGDERGIALFEAIEEHLAQSMS